MVARIVSGKSIRGVLNYNEGKVRDFEAELLLACGYLRAPGQLSFRDKLNRFEMLTSQNGKTKTNALHITLNFSKSETLDNLLLKRIALDYMERIGFGNQPFLVYRHYDAAHPHIHIATVNIADGGERIETHNIGRNQSEKARKEIELLYGLIKAEDQQNEIAFMLRPARLRGAVYGKSETKSAISSIVREVTGSYKFSSLPELNAVLAQFNVMANPGEEGSRMRERGGLVYCLLDDKGSAIGVPIKASSIYSSPTLKNLEKKYQPNDAARKPYGQRLKHQLDKAISTSKNISEMEKLLNRQGIRILMRRNIKGNIYGITFIDNATRVVFNGSTLGKAWSAKAFLEQLEKAFRLNAEDWDSRFQNESSIAEDIGVQEEKEIYPAQEHPVFAVLQDNSTGKDEKEQPNTLNKKIKRGLQAE